MLAREKRESVAAADLDGAQANRRDGGVAALMLLARWV